MFYKVKTKVMDKILKVRQEKNPFDYDKSEAFSLSENEDPKVNNSYYFSAHDYDNETSLYCRLGQRSSGNEVWFYYKDKEHRLVLNNLIFKEDNPLKIYKKDNKWYILFNGILEDENKNHVNVEFNGEFISDEKPLDFFTNMPRIRLAKAMAFEKWSKRFFEEVQANNQVHYEQLGRLTGTIKFNDNSINISLPCVRDHSFGAREWDYMNNHLWLMGVNDKHQLNFSMVSYPAMTLLEVGNFSTYEGDTSYMLEANYDRSELITGDVPNTFNVRLLLDNNEELDVNAKIVDKVEYYFGNGDYKFIEALCEYDINGEKYRGIFEVGFNKNRDRYFNGKDTKCLKI